MYFDKLNLASASPRRHELVQSLFNNIKILIPIFDEPRWSPGQLGITYVTHCVNEKWAAAEKSFSAQHGELFLVADTIVLLAKQVLGKPRNPKEAAQMLRFLSGKKHLVLTAFKLGYLATSKTHTEVVSSEVTFRDLTAKEIADYVRSREPLDKAGAYGFQGLGMQLIAAVKGPYSNIMGLPLHSVKAAADLLGVK